MSDGQKVYIRVNGMTCKSCEGRVHKKLLSLNHVKSVNVSYEKGVAEIEFRKDSPDFSVISSALSPLGYEALPLHQKNPQRIKALFSVAALVLVLAFFFVLQYTGAAAFFNAFPTAKAGMGYGALFLIGLLTSVHCVAMCGGIAISQSGTGCATKQVKDGLRPALLYNGGRVISYTLIGGVVGALGSAISLSAQVKGVIALGAGLFMILMALNMWGAFPWLRRFIPRLPKGLAGKIRQEKAKSSNRPFYIGLLNGFMPCGPLQAMQLFALASGSFISGALSMFFFSLGTVPLLFGLVALGTLLNQRFTKVMMTVGGALVLVLGVFMLGNGLALAGIALPVQNQTAVVAENKAQVQEVRTELLPNEYTPITVKSGTPVRWTIEVSEENLNGCNNKIIIPEYNIEQELKVGTNLIEFVPQKAGIVPFSCWMGMIKSQIQVEEAS